MVGWVCCGRRKKSKQDYHKFDHHCQSPNGFTSSTLHLENNDSKTNNTDSKQSSPSTNSTIGSPDKPRVFNYRELATATRNFHPDSFLGEGGFGSVYKGNLRTNEVVAVKKLNPMGFQGEKEFLVEVLMLSLLRHPNLVNMIGYCAEGTQRLLVLEFMPLGSLEAHLYDLPPEKAPLDWETRMKIAAGAAKGVDYLHNEAKPPVIYRDLKPSNILLDEGYHPKLSDFGLAKFGPVGDNSHVSTRVMGTHGYCAPEYASTGRLTPKSDTFSFGVVLLELLSGHKAVEIHPNGKRTSIVDWARSMLKDRKTQLQLVDPQLKGQVCVSAMRKAIEVAGMCIREDANTRPTMHEVAIAMEYLTSQKNDHDPPRSVPMGPNLAMDTKTRESPKILNLDIEREQAVAEAKLWGEQWREKKRQGESGGSDGVNSWVPKANDHQET